jgi:hypothetical protein
MKKALVACPRCENEGRRYILGELAPTGHVLIQRVHGSNGQYRNFTIVGGNDFYLVCDYCGTKVFFRKVEERRDFGTSFSYGESWFFRGTLGSEVGVPGTTSL